MTLDYVCRDEREIEMQMQLERDMQLERARLARETERLRNILMGGRGLPAQR